MNETTCDKFADKLVDFADGELSPNESAAVAEHVATCPRCRETVAALRRSLELAGVIWRAGEADVAAVQVPARRRPVSVWLRRSAPIAAGLLLFVGASLLWRTMHRPAPPPVAAANPPTVEEIRRTVARAGVAMRMLGAADYLAEQDGGREIAQERFRYIITTYPETTAAAEARSRLEYLTTQRT